ncbi:MAG: hypothetical protein AVDCRST_MAG65-1714, partial [uncultured Solirubrobacteraceae bacterium]
APGGAGHRREGRAREGRPAHRPGRRHRARQWLSSALRAVDRAGLVRGRLGHRSAACPSALGRGAL